MESILCHGNGPGHSLVGLNLSTVSPLLKQRDELSQPGITFAEHAPRLPATPTQVHAAIHTPLIAKYILIMRAACLSPPFKWRYAVYLSR